MKHQPRRLSVDLNPSEASSLYAEFLQTPPQFSSRQDALLAYSRELRTLADDRGMRVDELIQASENSAHRTDEQRRIMKLANWISAIA